MQKLSEEKKKTWIALSGNIASGKSSVLAYLKTKGYECYDCDQINAQLQQIHMEGYNQIVNWFGLDILNQDLSLNKRKIAELVFMDEGKRKQLEAIMHPLILEKLMEIKKQSQGVVFVEVPLLFELGWQKYFDETWLIISESKTLLERCMEKRNMSKKAFMMRYQAQMSVEEKIRSADVVIENNTDLISLYKRVDDVLKRGCYE